MGMERAPFSLPVGSLIRFRFPVTGGSHLALVATEPKGGDFAATIHGFPQGGLQAGERITVSPEWVEGILERAK